MAGKTIIQAKKDLFNGGKCFTKGELYTINKSVVNAAGLMECTTLNDQSENHIIGSWWRNFKIIN
jgi:hypothetical protein